VREKTNEAHMTTDTCGNDDH